MIRHEVPTITEFLLARIAEDEVKADEMATTAWYDGGWAMEDADRLRKDCAAKRAILKEHELSLDMRDPYCDTCAEWWNAELGEGPPMVPYPCPTVKAIAAVYSDHPDYQQKWAL